MLSQVFGIFSGGVGIISVVLSLFRGFERFLGGGAGGDIFGVINFYFHVHGKIEVFLRGLNFQKLRFSHGGMA